MGHKLGDVGPRAFGAHQVHVGAALAGHQHQDEDQHAHAADPVGKAAPEQARVGQDLHMLQDRRTGGGETGGDFKQRVDIAADLAGEHKGQRPTRLSKIQAKATIT